MANKTTVRTLLAQRGYDDAAIACFIREQRICTAESQPKNLVAKQRRALMIAAGTQRLPNGPLRDAVQASGMTYGDICRDLDWADSRFPHRFTPDTSRLQRMLGIKASSPNLQQGTVTLVVARQVAAVIGVELSVLYPEESESDGTQCVECGEALWWATGDTCGFCVEEQARGIAA